MPRSVLEVDVKDEKFKAFLDLFKNYQDQLGKMGEFWSDAGNAAEQTEVSTGSMVDAMAAGAASTALMVDALEKSGHHAIRADNTMRSMAGHAKSIASSILGATVSLAKWSALSLGAGLIGGGAGLYGLDALANSVGGQRKSALGLGVTTAEQQAFNVNYGTRLVGGDFLSNVQGVKADLGQQWMFSALGMPAGEMQQADTAALGIDVIRRAQQLWQQAGPGGHNTQWMQAHGLSGFMDFATWQRIGQASSGDLSRYEKQYGSDVGTMGASGADQTAWQDFSIQMKRAGEQIEAVLVRGLVDLTGPLSNLSGSIEKALSGFLGNPHMKEWVDDFGRAIEQFGHYLGSDKFQADLKTFVDDVAYAADKIVAGMQFLHLIPGNALSPDDADPSDARPQARGGGLPAASWPDWMKSSYEWMHGIPSGPELSGKFSQLERGYNLPPGLLTAVGIEESGLNPNVADSVVKGVHYRGPFQLGPDEMAANNVTDPHSMDQESAAAASILARYLKKYNNNVAEALAAYNWGPGNVDKDIKKHGADWLSYAPPETQKYIGGVANRYGVTITVLNQTGAQIAIAANGVQQ